MEGRYLLCLFLGVFSATAGSAAESPPEMNLEDTVIYLRRTVVEMGDRMSTLEKRSKDDLLEERNRLLSKMEEVEAESRNRVEDLSAKLRELRDEVLKRLDGVERRCEESATSLSGDLQSAESRFTKVDNHLLMEVLQLRTVSAEAVEKVKSVEREVASALESERHTLQVQMSELTSELGSVALLRKNVTSLTDALRLQLNESLTHGLESIRSNLTTRMRILENSSKKFEKDCAQCSAVQNDVLEAKGVLANHSSQLGKLKERVDKRGASDCQKLLEMGRNQSGVYEIWPTRTREPLRVYCDMVTDGGGWTVIQRRGNFQSTEEYFFRDWQSYKGGFGDVEKEFWLGNFYLFALTNQDWYSARFDLRDFENGTAHAHYQTFRVDDENHQYTLHIGGYSGDAGNSMAYHDGHGFSTMDRDNDEWPRMSCAHDFKGGWWYAWCHKANLNGLYLRAKDDQKGVTWKEWKGFEPLQASEIKVRPTRVHSTPH